MTRWRCSLLSAVLFSCALATAQQTNVAAQLIVMDNGLNTVGSWSATRNHGVVDSPSYELDETVTLGPGTWVLRGFVLAHL